MSGYKLPHGYAVSIGICIDLGYSVEKGLLKPADRDRVVGLLNACGALDGLNHSGHLLNQADNLLFGLDAWALSRGNDALSVVCGVGKSDEVQTADRETFRKVMNELAAAPANDVNLVK
jgi:3-dehydroquinate synthase